MKDQTRLSDATVFRLSVSCSILGFGAVLVSLMAKVLGLSVGLGFTSNQVVILSPGIVLVLAVNRKMDFDPSAVASRRSPRRGDSVENPSPPPGISGIPRSVNESVSGIVFIALSLIVFLLADGLRRYYSGVFLLMIGIVNLAISRREPKA